ncbi:cyclic nucleotide-binding domain-containing protein [Thermodesulfobacteriota bacterium]
MLEEIIADMPIFKDFTGKEIEIFADMDHDISEYKRGATIIEEGDCLTSIYIILKGSVKIVKKVDGRTILLARLKSGELFGEMAMFSDNRRHSDAVAGDDVQLLKIDEDFFKNAKPFIVDKMKNHFIELLINRLDSMNESLMAVSKLMRAK